MLGAFVIATSAPVAACALRWLVRRRDSRTPAVSGVPRLSLLRLAALTDLLVGAVAVAALAATRHHSVPLPLFQHRDVLPALLIGSLGGLFLHVTGGGSPLPLASLRGIRRDAGSVRRDEGDAAAILLLVAGVGAQELIWRGIGFGGLSLAMPGLAALVLSALGYGLQRQIAGEDQFALATMDGVLLGVIFRVSGSLVAAIVAHLIADLFAYTSVADLAAGDAISEESNSVRPDA